jgi:hypothetical protein
MYTSQLLCTKGKNLFVLPLTSKPDPEVVEIIFFDGVSNSLKKCKIMVRVVSAGNRIQVKNNKFAQTLWTSHAESLSHPPNMEQFQWNARGKNISSKLLC